MSRRRTTGSAAPSTATRGGKAPSTASTSSTGRSPPRSSPPWPPAGICTATPPGTGFDETSGTTIADPTGTTFLDALWADAPFPSRRAFQRAVAATARRWERAGLLSPAESATVRAAA
ncbi:hypothetical protein AB0F81_33755 [Actinoplanes sp. NPDC024001]|uniref:hypothetical protein n=1 Tax=Actinoplanes sp. NPDC024001 TaxID=3154598 RepID=UPI0033FE861D